MAKVPFSKLEAKVCNTSTSLVYSNSKGEEIHYEVKYYLPVEEKIDMITNIVTQSLDDNGFYNPIRVRLFTVLEVTYAYTNLNFTAKQKTDIFKLYDQLVSTGIFQSIKNAIWEEDWNEIEATVIQVLDNIYKYRNSAMGIMETIAADYSDMEFNAADIQKKIGDPNNLELLKNVLSSLG